jgi:hypothetical protein
MQRVLCESARPDARNDRLASYLRRQERPRMAEWSGVAGREVLIAGATSGIGLADAKELARRGAKLAIVARSEAEGCETVERIQAVGGTDARAEVLIADLASRVDSEPGRGNARSLPGDRCSHQQCGRLFRTRPDAPISFRPTDILPTLRGVAGCPHADECRFSRKAARAHA